MKKTITLMAFTGLLYGVQGQACSDLFISEYIEGTNNNKAIELYNPTNAPIDLGNYRFIRWDNGATPPLMGDIADNDPSKVQPLPAGVTIPAYGTYVIALNLTDPSGTGQNAPIDAALQAKADTLFSDGCSNAPGNIRTMCFNGDDALELQKRTSSTGPWLSVDIFACIGERPTNNSGNFSPVAGWTAIPPFSSMPPTYNSQTDGPYWEQYWTRDKGMVRKPGVMEGVKVNPAPETFNPSVQWDTIAVDTYDSLGTHHCDCQFLSVDALTGKETVLYPNPSVTGEAILKVKDGGMREIRLFDLRGNMVWSSMVGNQETQIVVGMPGLARGVYVLRIEWTDGSFGTLRLVRQ
jgi:hypothetical protein